MLSPINCSTDCAPAYGDGPVTLLGAQRPNLKALYALERPEDFYTDSCRLVLASRSPRRLQLLQGLDLDVEVLPPAPGCEPDLHPGENLESICHSVALSACAKACSAAGLCAGESPALVFGADTVVVLDNSVLEKPADLDEAQEMLVRLSGRCHTVVTGISWVARPAGQIVGGAYAVAPDVDSGWLRAYSFVRTMVRFRSLSRDEIAAYVAGARPLDKAGAYGIQELGGLLVQDIQGCYFNVVGLPLTSLYKLARLSGCNLLALGCRNRQAAGVSSRVAGSGVLNPVLNEVKSC